MLAAAPELSDAPDEAPPPAPIRVFTCGPDEPCPTTLRAEIKIDEDNYEGADCWDPDEDQRL